MFTWGERFSILILGGEVEVLVTLRRACGVGVNQFRRSGIDATARKMVADTSELQHWAEFGGIASTIFDADTPGLANQVLGRLPYQKIRRPLFRLDEMWATLAAE